jgi:hypothetical protein
LEPNSFSKSLPIFHGSFLKEYDECDAWHPHHPHYDCHPVNNTRIESGILRSFRCYYKSKDWHRETPEKPYEKYFQQTILILFGVRWWGIHKILVMKSSQINCNTYGIVE